MAKLSDADDDASRWGQYQHCVIHDKQTTHTHLRIHTQTRAKLKDTRAGAWRKGGPAGGAGTLPSIQEVAEVVRFGGGPGEGDGGGREAPPQPHGIAVGEVAISQQCTGEEGNSLWPMAKTRSACGQDGSGHCRMFNVLKWPILSG